MINDFALIVRHIVIFKQVFTNIEVVRLDFALRFFDLARQKRALDRLTLAHAGTRQ